jgi:putative PIG3 family NAD(P)H quinone oxidoreductase
VRAAVYVRPGDAGTIELREIPAPEWGPRDLLVDVAYAGLNRADLLERAGRYGIPIPPGGYSVPGMEYAGTVAAAGNRVEGFAPGDRVFGIVAAGAHAAQVAVDAGTALRVPDGLSLEAAAALPEAFITAWDALIRSGGFTLGKTVVVHAIGSGVGLAALALAKHAGGTVLGTSRSEEKLVRARALGLDEGVLLDADWPARALAMTGGRGADLALDFIGTATFDRNVQALATGARIVQIGTLGGARGEIALGPFMAKRLSYVGTVLRSRPLDEKIALAREFQAHVVPLFGTGALQGAVDRTFALDEIADAHRHMEADRNFGKVLLAIG